MDSINTEALDHAALEVIPEGSLVAIRLKDDPTPEKVDWFHVLGAVWGITFLLLGPGESAQRLTDVPERELREHLLRARREPSVQDMAASLLEQFVIARRPEFRRRK